MPDTPVSLTQEQRAEIDAAAQWAIERGYIKTRRDFDAFIQRRESQLMRNAAARAEEQAPAAAREAYQRRGARILEERELSRERSGDTSVPGAGTGAAGRFRNRFDVTATRMGANIADMLGFDEKAADVRRVADETERYFADAQTPEGKIAGAAGYVGPHALGTIASTTALQGLASAPTVANNFPRVARAIDAILGGKNASIVRQNIGGEVASAPLSTIPGAFSDDPNQSITGMVDPDASKITRLVGDMGLGVIGGSALQAGGRQVFRAGRAGVRGIGNAIDRAFLPDIGEDAIEAGMDGVQAELRANNVAEIRGNEAGRIARRRAQIQAEREAAAEYNQFQRDLTSAAAEATRLAPRRAAMSRAGTPMAPADFPGAQTSAQQMAADALRVRRPAAPSGVRIDTPLPEPVAAPAKAGRRGKNRRGAASTALLSTLGGAAAGGAVGGIVDDDNPIEGAAFGAVAGAGIPAMLRAARNIGGASDVAAELPANEMLKRFSEMPRPTSSDFMVQEAGARPTKEALRDIGVAAGMFGASELTDDETASDALKAAAVVGTPGGRRGARRAIPNLVKDATEGALTAYHTIPVRNFRKMMEWGGLPVPSVAVTRPDIASVTFDKAPIGSPEESITLLGGRSLIDPVTGNVAERDQWSALFPESQTRTDANLVYPSIFNDFVVEASQLASGAAPVRRAVASLEEIAEDIQNGAVAPDMAYESIQEHYRDIFSALARGAGGENGRDMLRQMFAGTNAKSVTSAIEESASSAAAKALTMMEGSEVAIGRNGMEYPYDLHGITKAMSSYADPQLGMRGSGGVAGSGSVMAGFMNSPLDYGGALSARQFRDIEEMRAVAPTLSNRSEHAQAFGRVRNAYDKYESRAAQHTIQALNKLDGMGAGIYGDTDAQSSEAIMLLRNAIGLAQEQISRAGDNRVVTVADVMDKIRQMESGSSGFAAALLSPHTPGTLVSDAIESHAPAKKALAQMVDAYAKGSRINGEYFEGKPPRAVSKDEFLGVMAPSRANPETIEAIKRSGMPYHLYDVPDEVQKLSQFVDPVTGRIGSQGQLFDALSGIGKKDNTRLIPDARAEQAFVKGAAGLRDKLSSMGKQSLFGIAGAAALPDDAQAQDGSEDGGMSPMDMALLAAGIGLGGRAIYKNRGAISGALRGEMGRDMAQVVEEAAARGAVKDSMERVATREANAAARVRKPIAPYPDDAYDPVTDVAELLQNPSRVLRDAGGYRESQETIQRLIAEGKVSPTGKIPWSLERETADILAVSPSNLATRDAKRKLSGAELLGLRNQFTRDSQRQAQVAKILNDPTTTDQDRRIAEQLYDALESRITVQYNRLTRDVSQTGRDLNLLKIAGRFSNDPRDWWLRAKKLAGDHEVPAEVKADLLRALERQDWTSASMALNRARQTTAWDKGGEGFQTALLASLARPVRDVFSNGTALADRAVQGQVARVLDRAISTFSGVTNYDAPVGRSVKAAIRGSREGAAMAAAILSGSGDPAILERAARRYDFSNETSFRNPLMRAFGRAVRRSIASVDAIAYEGSFALSMEHQAWAMAKNRGLDGDAASRFVEGMLTDPPADMVLRATEDATETVWQNKTPLGEFGNKLRSLRSAPARFVGKVVVPFSQTPSAMVSEAISRSPVGALATVGDFYRFIKAKGADVPEAQRRVIKRIAAQSTGAAWIYAGYYLASKGDMTGAFPEDANERARWQEEGKVENAIRHNGKWVGISGLLGPQAMLMSIGAFMAEAVREDGRMSAGDVASASVAGTANALIDSPMMQGLDATTEALQAARSQDPDRQRGAVDQLGQSFIGGWVPRFIQQIAAGMDVDENGNTIMRDPQASGSPLAFLQQGVPGLREELPEKVSPFGRTRTSGTGGVIRNLMSPIRGSQDYSTPLTEALGAMDYFPTSGSRTSEQKRVLGPIEEQLMQGILSGDPQAWAMVSPAAIETYQNTGDPSELFRSAIRNYRQRLSRQ